MPSDNKRPRVRALLRKAAALHCLVCGRAPMFDGWFRMRRHCTACGYRFEREPGYFLGAIYINYGVTAATLVALVVGYLLAWGSPTPVMFGAGIAFALLFPVWFSRYARALFMALDLYWHGVEERDFEIRDPQ